MKLYPRIFIYIFIAVFIFLFVKWCRKEYFHYETSIALPPNFNPSLGPSTGISLDGMALPPPPYLTQISAPSTIPDWFTGLLQSMPSLNNYYTVTLEQNNYAPGQIGVVRVILPDKSTKVIGSVSQTPYMITPIPPFSPDVDIHTVMNLTGGPPKEYPQPIKWLETLLSTNTIGRPYYKIDYLNQGGTIAQPNEISNSANVYIRLPITNQYSLLGTIGNESGKITLPGGLVTDIQLAVNLTGLPKEWSCNWLIDFLAQNDGAKKFGSNLQIQSQTLYLQPANSSNLIGDKSKQGTPFEYTDEQGFSLVNPTYSQKGLIGLELIGKTMTNPLYNRAKYGDTTGSSQKAAFGCISGKNFRGITGKETSTGISQYDMYCSSYKPIPQYGSTDGSEYDFQCPDNSQIVGFRGSYTPEKITSLQIVCNGKPQSLGFTDDNHIGLLRTSDGTWLDIADVFTLIAGPKNDITGAISNCEFFSFSFESKEEYYSYLHQLEKRLPHLTELQQRQLVGQNIEFFRVMVERYGFNPFLSDSWKDLGNTIYSDLKEGWKWVKDRAGDVSTFAKNAVDSIGDWAKNMSSRMIDWCKNAGRTVAESFVRLGNYIGCIGRKFAQMVADSANLLVREFKDMALEVYKQLLNLGQLAKDAFNSAINWIRNQASYVWDKIGGPVGVLLNIILQGAPCEYYISRKISGLEAVKAIEAPIIPNLRDAMLQLIETILSTISAGILTPLIVVIMPIVQQFSDLNEKIDGLLSDLFHQNFMVIAITTVADPIINSVMSKGCSLFLPPDISDIQVTFDVNLDDVDLDDSAFDDL